MCKSNHKIYIGSSENLVKRFKEQIKGKKSNIRLQRTISTYGLSNFYFVIFESYNVKNKILLTKFESSYLSYFKLNYLYNIKRDATSLVGYKHTEKTKQKLVDRFKKFKHPLLGKHHTDTTKHKISLATKGEKNPMFGKKHSDKSKELISIALGKSVYMYKIIEDKFQLIEIYPNSVKVAKLLNLNKTTIGRYIKKKKIFI